MPTEPARNQQMTPLALRVLILLLALAGRGDVIHTTKAGLAGALGKHPKSVQKAVALLAKLGYITRDVWRSENGRNRGLAIAISPEARPFWHGKPMGANALPHLRHGKYKGEGHDNRVRIGEGRRQQDNACGVAGILLGSGGAERRLC